MGAGSLSYPKGVAVLSRHLFLFTGGLNPNETPVPPLLSRKAVMSSVEIGGKRFIFVSSQLDHHHPPGRKVQLDRFLGGLDLWNHGSYHAAVLAGDFKNIEDSPELRSLMERGLIDTDRALNEVLALRSQL